MNVNTIFIHCNDFHGNKNLRAEVANNGQGVTLTISSPEDNKGQIHFFMSEKDLINFKNSVVSAVDNYKRNKK